MTFIQNLGRFLDVTGIQGAPAAWWLAGVDWPTDADREDFIYWMAQPSGREPVTAPGMAGVAPGQGPMGPT